jgi:hypothetical protein
VWLAFANGHGEGDDVEHVLPDLEALGQFAEELRRRLAVDGLDGIDGTLALHRQLKSTLDSIDGPELDRIREDVRALERWFAETARILEGIARLKRLVDV